MAFTPGLYGAVEASKAMSLTHRYCEQEAHRYPDGDLMSQAKILDFLVWLVDEAVQQNGARYSFSSVGDYLCHLKEVRREQYAQGRITSDVPAPLEIQAVRDLVRARGREMQAENLNAQVAAQLCQSLQTAFQQKQWQWAYLLRMAMTFMPATLGRSNNLRKLPWSCLALRTQDGVGAAPSVAILFGSMQGKTVKPGQVDIPGVVRYRDHRVCPQAALADLAVATFHRGIKLEDLAKFIVAAPSMQGNQPMSGETLNVHLRQAFELAGLMGTQLKAKSATSSRSMVWRRLRAWASAKRRSRWRARHESDTTDLYCIFHPDTAHRLAGWGRDWHENHRLGQAKFKKASLRIDLYGEQWLRTIPPAASRLLQSAASSCSRRLGTDTLLLRRFYSDSKLLRTDPRASFIKALGGKGATPFAPRW
eukprot:jgi/Astpho2/8678/Aster-05248